MIFSLAEQIRYELTSVFRGYPSFVLRASGKLRHHELPVFVFHTINPEEFESHLKYLQRNNYVTVDLDQYLDALNGKTPLPEKSVLLTIDDGRSSFWRFGYPLLKRYQMKATLFVIPGYIQATHDNNENLLTLSDSDRNRAYLKTIDPEDQTLCSWEQLREMHMSGYIAIESHSLFHREVFTSPQIVGWVDANTSFIPHYTPITAFLDFSDVGLTIKPEDFYGLPLFKSTPFLAGKPALIIPQTVKDFCLERFGKETPEQIQKALDASGLLHQLRYQTELEVEAAIEKDLQLAQQLIQQQVSSHAGNHLCLPFTMGCPAVLRACERLDIHSCSWGTIPGKRINSTLNPELGAALNIVRIKSDFIPRLPGHQRLSLLGIYLNKLSRRFRNEAIY